MYRSLAYFNINTIISLPNNKILDWCKLKVFADDKINVNEKLKFSFKRIENIVGKGKNAALPTMFSKDILYRVIKSQDYW